MYHFCADNNRGCENWKLFGSVLSIRINHEKIGMELAKTLHRMLGRKWSPSNVLIGEMESSVTERKSTMPPVPAAHLIHKGLDYIKARAGKPITVSDVVKHLGVSRRLAELSFAELHGSTIGDTIRSNRLERARVMLENSSLNIGRIAESCGFPSRRSAEILFKTRFGLTMGEYRKRHSLCVPASETRQRTPGRKPEAKPMRLHRGSRSLADSL